MLLPTQEIKNTLAKVDVASQEVTLTLRAVQRLVIEATGLVQDVRETLDVIRQSKQTP